MEVVWWGLYFLCLWYVSDVGSRFVSQFMWHVRYPKSGHYMANYHNIWNYLYFTTKYSVLKVLKYFIGKNNTRSRVYMFYSQLRGQTGLLNGFECRLAFQAPSPLILWRPRVKAPQIHWMPGCISSFICAKPVVFRLMLAESLGIVGSWNLYASLQQLNRIQ